jgi:hypothetical protein
MNAASMLIRADLLELCKYTGPLRCLEVIAACIHEHMSEG